jgi:hypothetical protein
MELVVQDNKLTRLILILSRQEETPQGLFEDHGLG